MEITKEQLVDYVIGLGYFLTGKHEELHYMQCVQREVFNRIVEKYEFEEAKSTFIDPVDGIFTIMFSFNGKKRYFSMPMQFTSPIGYEVIA